MNKLVAGAVGVAVGIPILLIWESWPGKDAFKAKAFSATSLTGEPEKSPLAFVEHYHWGLGLLLVRQPLFDGIGASMVASESFGEKPFGVGKSEYEVKGNVALASVLVGLLGIRLGSG